jgi:hypothetical protein
MPHGIKLFDIIILFYSFFFFFAAIAVTIGKIFKLQLLVSGEPNSSVSSVPSNCKDEGAQIVSAVAPSTSIPSSLAADQCEVSGIVDAVLRGPWSPLNENYGMLS